MRYFSTIALKWIAYLLRTMLLCLALLSTCANFQAQGLQSFNAATRQQKEELVYYAESWKKGTNQIQEQASSIRLDRYNSFYKMIVKDDSGERDYKLTVIPFYRVSDSSGEIRFERKPGDTQDGSVSSWDIQLFESGEKDSLLVASRGSGGDMLALENTLAWLEPIEDEKWIKVGIFGVPITRKRVFKVEGFYCVIKVKSYQLSRTQARAFESVELEIEFTNTWKPDIPTLTGKDRLTVDGDLDSALRLTSNPSCDKALQHTGIASLAAEVRKLQLGDANSQHLPSGNIFDGRQALHKIVDRYTGNEKTIREYLNVYKSDKAVTSFWQSRDTKDGIIFLGANYFKDSDPNRAITLIREAAHRAGVKDIDFGKLISDGMFNLTKLLKEKCQ